MAAAKPGPGQRLGPRAVLIRTQEVARKLVRATVPLADSPVSALPRAPLVAGGPAGGAERFAVLALGVWCRAPVRPDWSAWLGVVADGLPVRPRAPGQACSCGRAGYSGLPQRLQKAALASWCSLRQCGQGWCSASPRMALASSAVKMPVGTAMIE